MDQLYSRLTAVFCCNKCIFLCIQCMSLPKTLGWDIKAATILSWFTWAGSLPRTIEDVRNVCRNRKIIQKDLYPILCLPSVFLLWRMWCLVCHQVIAKKCRKRCRICNQIHCAVKAATVKTNPLINWVRLSVCRRGQLQRTKDARSCSICRYGKTLTKMAEYIWSILIKLSSFFSHHMQTWSILNTHHPPPPKKIQI